jgi:hypothetical protein
MSTFPLDPHQAPTGPKQVAFMTGSGHSGTTLLHLIISSHSRAFGLGELMHLGRSDRVCSVCEGACPFWDVRADKAVLRRYFTRRSFGAPIVLLAARYQRSFYRHALEWSERDLVLDSTKSIRWISRQLVPSRHWRDMRPVLFFMSRDGRAVVNSYLRKNPGRSVDEVAHEWKERIERAQRFFASVPSDRRFRVVYEELATRPQEIVPPICDFLGLDYEPAMLRYWEHDHHLTGGNFGTQWLVMRYQGATANGVSPRAAEFEKRHARHGSYYLDHEVGISLDLRWKEELSRDALKTFDQIAGSTNREFAYEA